MITYMVPECAKYMGQSIDTDPRHFVKTFVEELLQKERVELRLQPGDGTDYRIGIARVERINGVFYVYIFGEGPLGCVHLENEEFDAEYIQNIFDINPVTAQLIAELHHHIIEETDYYIDEDDDSNSDKYEHTYYDLSNGNGRIKRN